MHHLDKILYQAHAKATGGRDGHVSTMDGQLSMDLARPKELGGLGNGYNPEQLFASGYSACFLGAMKFVADKEHSLVLPESTAVEALVSFGPITKGFGLEVELRVSIPGVETQLAQAIVNEAHQICPYSNATRGNIKVTLTLHDS